MTEKKKILFLGAGSPSDPRWDASKVNGEPMLEHMAKAGITVNNQIIESCHGCPEMMAMYSRQLQSRAILGDRVVAVLEGGLLFGLPSIQAVQTTFPIISSPLDYVSYQAFIVPPGHAVVAGVGILTAESAVRKSVVLAERILNLDDICVEIAGDIDGKLEKELKGFGIPVGKSKLKVAYMVPTPAEGNYGKDDVLILANASLDPKKINTIQTAESWHHMLGPKVPWAEVYGPKNLAIYAMKILSLNQPEFRYKIEEIAAKKFLSYEVVKAGQ